MAERGGHAPLALWAHDVFSKDSRLARPVHVPFDTPGRARTDTERSLSPLPLLWATGVFEMTNSE
jgi:hypothetical protein